MKVRCEMCNGTGKYWILPSEKCRSCKGTGEEEVASPTEETEHYWIGCEGKSYKMGTRRPGKWLLFVNKKKIDEVWKTIRQETMDEKLGMQSKVSTKAGWLDHGMPEDYVICVHTYNYEDKEDVKQVRNRLRELGFTNELGYKTDEATLNDSNEILYKE